MDAMTLPSMMVVCVSLLHHLKAILLSTPREDGSEAAAISLLLDISLIV